jgi:hypothetical protein
MGSQDTPAQGIDNPMSVRKGQTGIVLWEDDPRKDVLLIQEPVDLGTQADKSVSWDSER